MTFKIINADDFGICNETNEIILELLNLGKINSTSVLYTQESSDSLTWSQLKGLKAIHIGLHLYLTEMNGKTLMDLLLGLITGRLLSSEIEAEFEKQLKGFIDYFEVPPSHIDSHQHVHQLPFIRTALLNVLKRNNLTNIPIRNSDSPLQFCIRNWRILGLRSVAKNIYLALMGKSCKTLLISEGLPTNRFLLGTYSFTDRVSYKSILQCYCLFQYNQDDIYYCHPGAGKDPIGAVRINEYHSLKQ